MSTDNLMSPMACTHYSSSDSGKTLEPDKPPVDNSVPEDDSVEGAHTANEIPLHKSILIIPSRSYGLRPLPLAPDPCQLA